MEHTIRIFALKHRRVLRPSRLPLQDRSRSGSPRRSVRMPWLSFWWDRRVGTLSAIFLEILVNAICVTIKYARVEATSCGLFGLMEQRMQGLD